MVDFDICNEIFSQACQEKLELGGGPSQPITLINQTFLSNVEKSLTIEKFDSIFTMCKNNKDRIRLFSKYFPTSEVFFDFYHQASGFKKDKASSNKLRERANTNFRLKKFSDSLRGYNLSLCFSTPDTEEMGLAYANRSAVFLELDQQPFLKYCLKDIQLALKHGYPHVEKLEKRKIKCLRRIADIENNTADENSTEPVDAYRDDILFKIANPNPLMPAAENIVTVAFHPKRGRELVLTQDVKPGTTLIVDRPFIHILKETLQWEFGHCHNCLKKIYNGIPCKSCVFVVFCSDECREEALKTFHSYECACYPYLYLNQTPRFVILTLRLISKLGPVTMSELYQNPEMLEEKTKIYDSDSYTTIYNLVSHANVQNELNHFTNVLQSLILVTLLENLTTFFKYLKKEVQNCNEFRSWLTSITLHHLQNLPCNSLSLDKLKNSGELIGKVKNDEDSIKKAEIDQFASGVYGTISLINHSCDPNVTRLTDSFNGCRIAIVSIKSIKAGEPLYTSYTKSINDPLDERQEYLNDNYYFTCMCQPCVEKWPLLTQLLRQPQDPRFLCVRCLKPISQNGRCGSCKQKHNTVKLKTEYDRQIEAFYKCYEFVLKNEPIKAIDRLIPILEYFQGNIVSPFGKTFMVQDTFKRALDLIVYFRN